MKILQIITKGEIGGAQRIVLEIARGLKQAGDEVTVAFGEGTWLNEELGKSAIPTIHFASLKRSFNPFQNIFFIAELYLHLRKNQYDALHFHSSNTLFGSYAALATSTKTVCTLHGLSLLDPGYETSILIKWAYRQIFRLLLMPIDVIVAITQSNAQYLEAHAIAHPTLIPNAIDPSQNIMRSREEAIS